MQTLSRTTKEVMQRFCLHSISNSLYELSQSNNSFYLIEKKRRKMEIKRKCEIEYKKNILFSFENYHVEINEISAV